MTAMAVKELRKSIHLPFPGKSPDGLYLVYAVLPARILNASPRKRPYRTEYIHLTCGATTVIHNPAIAETLAVDPDYYYEIFCSVCREHLPPCEFVWRGGTMETVGS